MKYRVIHEHSRRSPLRLLCRALTVAPVGYDAWAGRPECTRSAHHLTLLSAIQVRYRESRKIFGSPSIWDALINHGHGVGKNRISRLMRVEGVRVKTVKKWRATTQSKHRVPVAENTLNRQFTVAHPNRCGPGTSPTCGLRRAGSISQWSSVCTRLPWLGGRWTTV